MNREVRPAMTKVLLGAARSFHVQGSFLAPFLQYSKSLLRAETITLVLLIVVSNNDRLM